MKNKFFVIFLNLLIIGSGIYFLTQLSAQSPTYKSFIVAVLLAAPFILFLEHLSDVRTIRKELEKQRKDLFFAQMADDTPRSMGTIFTMFWELYVHNRLKRKKGAVLELLGLEHHAAICLAKQYRKFSNFDELSGVVLSDFKIVTDSQNNTQRDIFFSAIDMAKDHFVDRFGDKITLVLEEKIKTNAIPLLKIAKENPFDRFRFFENFTKEMAELKELATVA